MSLGHARGFSCVAQQQTHSEQTLPNHLMLMEALKIPFYLPPPHTHMPKVLLICIFRASFNEEKGLL